MNVMEPSVGAARQPATLVATTPSASKAAAGTKDTGPKDTAGGSSAGTRDAAAIDAAAVVTLSETAQASLATQTAGKKDFATVAKDARAAIDAKYAELAANGKPMDYMHATQESWDTVYGGLDRRALFAIASNSDGSFSKDEQNTAQSIMSQQQGQAMMAADPTGNDHAARFRAGVAFLEGVSDEEKASANWAVQRAATQFGYEQSMRSSGREPDDLDSENPLVAMIKGAMDRLKDKSPEAVATGGYVKDLKDMPLFRDGVPAVAAGTSPSLDIRA
ncbi:hypothetical protein TSH58p_09400 [Azospirillum sp. TSH58]|uniref:hypothetical protein n=1 Tax=Azospirillum sp. TSH58 TaxID=664962 RepID=UPI000D600554|nr:hypothetical protein [Azospirillum sp. TSH58]AWJ83720.1 hypothetical protein TSH58p_09400 [Azospirillum sp. TSH58]PWC61970.1 hypothetical protein TSH58_25845 [Azospirillum sp. TSH58]